MLEIDANFTPTQKNSRSCAHLPEGIITTHNEKGEGAFCHNDMDDHCVLPNSVVLANITCSTRSNPVDLFRRRRLSLSPLSKADIPSPRFTTKTARSSALLTPRLAANRPCTEITLDSGESRAMKLGDMSAQRGTMHKWRNCSDTERGRMV